MTQVSSPLTGRAIGLAAVPDPVSSGAMAGPGTAVDPGRGPAAPAEDAEDGEIKTGGAPFSRR